MMTKLFVSLMLLGVHETNSRVELKPFVHSYDEGTQLVIDEYESACLRKTIHLSGEGYTCLDLKRYLYKRGYSALK